MTPPPLLLDRPWVEVMALRLHGHVLLPLEELFLIQILLGQLLFPLEGGIGIGGAAVCDFPRGELLLLQRRRSFISSSSC